jgi:choloylglycine hydrolase
MRKLTAAALLLSGCLGWAVTAREAAGCTTFCLRHGEGAVFGRNYDWDIGYGLVVVNKRGVAKGAMLPLAERPARWTSRYGSLTFNQYGREFPTGGMNEAGLVVEVMWLDATRYPAPGERPGVGALEWVQYQLDNYASIDDVVRNAGQLRISSNAMLHYLICEKSGRCAAVEFLNGKPVTHSGEALPLPVLANSTYDESLRSLEKGGPAAGPSSLARFARAARKIRDYKGNDPVGASFRILADVTQGAYTKWSIVYDLGARRVYWQTAANSKRRWVDVGSFDFACASPVLMLDIDSGAGDVTRRFSDYRLEANRDLVLRSVRGTPFLRGMPPAEIDAAVHQPERTACTLSR